MGYGKAIELEGMSQFLDKLGALGPKTRTKVEHAVNASVLEALQMVRAGSAVRTGRFKAGWQVRAAGGTRDIIWREIYNPVEYSIFVLLGTRHMSARDCLTPGMVYGRNRINVRLAHIKIID